VEGEVAVAGAAAVVDAAVVAVADAVAVVRIRKSALSLRAQR
jgi:hypothetical protein